MNVAFCGHSAINKTDGFSKWLAAILPSVIEGGAETFYLGGYGAFDGLAAKAVRQQKAVYPHIEMVLVLAYLDREIDASGYDSTTYPPLEKVPRALCHCKAQRVDGIGQRFNYFRRDA